MNSLSLRLDETITRLPYNNAEPLFQKHGRETLRFGGSCVQQQRVLRERLAEDGVDMRYLVAPGSYHTVGIVRQDAAFRILDVAYRMRVPAAFNGTGASETVTVPAYSASGIATNALRFERSGEVLREEMLLVAGGSEQTQKSETFALPSASERLPTIEQDIETILQDRRVIIMAVMEGETILLQAPPDGPVTIRPSNGSRVRAGTPAFDEAFARLAGVNGGSPDELREYLKEAASLLQGEL